MGRCAPFFFLSTRAERSDNVFCFQNKTLINVPYLHQIHSARNQELRCCQRACIYLTYGIVQCHQCSDAMTSLLTPLTPIGGSLIIWRLRISQSSKQASDTDESCNPVSIPQHLLDLLGPTWGVEISFYNCRCSVAAPTHDLLDTS